MVNKNKIYLIRDKEVILDRDLAKLLNLGTGHLNERVKRNLNKISTDDIFKLTKSEIIDWISQIEISNSEKKGLRKPPFVFTKEGVISITSILKKELNVDEIFTSNESSVLVKKDDVLSSKIYDVRGFQVMLDFDLAKLYQVSTKRINEQVKRNIERFPNRFMFQLNELEINELVADCDRFKTLKHSTSLPFVFTERGIAMLATVLHSNIAIDMSIKIMDAFVDNRSFIGNNADIFQRLGNIEQKVIAQDARNIESDDNFKKIFNAIESNDNIPKQNIFYDGQIYDAYNFVNDVIKSAKNSIILIDNYIDNSVLTLFSERNKDCSVKIFTKNITKKLELDLKKYNKQYPKIELTYFEKSHDRFMIIDDSIVYHIGASLKDLGKKWFAFSKMNIDAMSIINMLNTGGIK